MGWWTRSEVPKWRTLFTCSHSSPHCASFLALFKVTVPFNLVTLGLAVLALHLAWPIAIRGRRWPYRRAE